jgi:hypothetical protein
VYLLPKQPVEPTEIRINRAELHPADNKVGIEVENTGDNFGRVLETQLVYPKKKQEAPGFPLFPHSKRILEFALAQKAEGENVPVACNSRNSKLNRSLNPPPPWHPSLPPQRPRRIISPDRDARCLSEPNAPPC